DYLPAGFEIDNPHLVSSGDTGTLSWIENAVQPAHSEFRDARFSAAFDRKAGDPAIFAVAYVVRAVSPGRYVLPQAYVEDMFRPYPTIAGRWRLPVRLDEVDPRFFAILFAYEDKRFRTHFGVDAAALARAGFQFVASGRIVSGGSTLTMQVARLLEPRADRTI